MDINDAFTAHQNNERLQYRSTHSINTTWYDVCEYTYIGVFSKDYEFRLKPKFTPKIITVEIFEFGFVPSYGQEYFHVVFKNGAYCVDSKVYKNCSVDDKLVECGIYETEQYAMTLADALNQLKMKSDE